MKYIHSVHTVLLLLTMYVRTSSEQVCVLYIIMHAPHTEVVLSNLLTSRLRLSMACASAKLVLNGQKAYHALLYYVHTVHIPVY